jgi:hypothetical protein
MDYDEFGNESALGTWGGGDWGGFQSGDTYNVGNTSYMWTGTNWSPVDTTAGQGSDTTTAAQKAIAAQDDFYRSIGLDPASIKDAPAADKKAMEGLYSTAGSDAASAGVIKTIKDAFSKKDAAGNVTGYDWARIAAMAPAALSMFGLDKKETNTYQGTVPSLSATRKQIEYDDPNRRAGSGGRQYFTDTQYTAKGAEAAGKSISDAQAEGILAGYTKAAAPTNKWAGSPTIPALAMPWQKKETTGTTAKTGTAAATSAADDFETPAARAARFGALIPEAIKFPERAESEVMSNLRKGNIGSSPTHLGLGHGEGINMNNNNPNYSIGNPDQVVTAAKGRYLRGPTDGMADELNTSIDNKQPAKLSHGEFVVPADVVSHLGNGNSDAGAKKLYSMMDKVRQARTGTKKQGKQINPDKYMPGGTVNKYAAGGIAQLPTKKFNGSSGSTVTNPAGDTTTSGGLANWSGEFVTNMLGQGQALANQPYQAYKGPLTAGASDLQNQAFTGASNLASTGYDPTTFNTGTFNTTAAQQYMNPFLSTALDPQMKELQRQSDIQRLSDSARLAKAGAFGGGRQAIMESEARRNLLDKQAGVLGTGYKNAYDAAMAQFNADQNRGLDTQKASEQSRQYGADYGLKALNELQESGATQRAIEAEGIKADKEQFEEQRDWPYKMVQYQQGLLQGLPISAQTNTQNMSALTSLLSNAGYAGQLYDAINKIFNPTAAKTN